MTQNSGANALSQSLNPERYEGDSNLLKGLVEDTPTARSFIKYFDFDEGQLLIATNLPYANQKIKYISGVLFDKNPDKHLASELQVRQE